MLTEQEKIRIAKRAIEKNWDWEALYYSDDMYGIEKQTDEVWKYVKECREEGENAFYKKYQD